jgi:hypothetical protein
VRSPMRHDTLRLVQRMPQEASSLAKLGDHGLDLRPLLSDRLTSWHLGSSHDSNADGCRGGSRPRARFRWLRSLRRRVALFDAYYKESDTPPVVVEVASPRAVHTAATI